MEITEGGLILEEESRCLGYLMDFGNRGVFSPNGKVEVTRDQVEAHNKALSEAEIAGLDKADIGKYGMLYWSPTKGVHTFIGTHVADYTINGNSLTFRRPNGHVFRGRTRKDADCFQFKRIS